MTRLEVQSLTVVRGKKRILDRITARIAAPGLTAVIGPNGAGKSTLLMALAGLLKPDEGAVTLDGAPVLAIDRRALARRRAYLPQNARCEWPISVERVVALGLTPVLPAFGALPQAERARISDMLAHCDLTDRREQAATTLSGGELARTMLARAMVGDPEMLIADEPISGLDPRHALDAMRRLRALADAGRLVVAALHDLSLAARYADRVLALKDGRVLVEGATADVFSPALLKDLFDVETRIVRDEAGLSVRFVDAN
ncbi:MAG: ABC transporter ATP-binding protein [Hydrogenophilaceae bacterium]|jgi:iron complex transport system ATP-binding protein|nr:ABC transporter ATP-binding protein [Hydrogenophilaceae bacterium]